MEIEKVYEPQRFEPRWAKWWEESQLFRVEARPGEVEQQRRQPSHTV